MRTATVEEVHRDIDGLHTQLIEQANQLIDEGKDELEYLSKLYELHFTSVPKVSKRVKDIVKYIKAKEMSDYAVHYRDRYPNTKFVTEKGVEYICKKYSLLMGSVTRFAKEIPLENIREIAEFKVATEDRAGERAFIIAKPEDFNLEGHKVEGYKVVDADPIVLMPVHGGFLIVSKWGEEADIEEVQGVAPFKGIKRE